VTRPAGVIDGLERMRLRDLGIPDRFLDDRKASYLVAVWRGEDGAAAAGVAPSTVRGWRSRDPEFRAAEYAVKTGQHFRPPIAAEPTREGTPGVSAELQRRIDDCLDTCRAIGMGPWRGSTTTNESLLANYNLARADLEEIATELRARHHTVPFSIPEPQDEKLIRQRLRWKNEPRRQGRPGAYASW
jgi:hypothetical protein